MVTPPHCKNNAGGILILYLIAMAQESNQAKEESSELRQWWYGEDAVVEYISTVVFKGMGTPFPRAECRSGGQ
jgi:hypothetical protein